MSSTRDQIIETTCGLLESQGFHATGLNQIVKASGAPKGSLYHYFPQGKDELAEAAIERAGQGLAERIAASLAHTADVAEAVREFVNTIAGFVEVSGFHSGGPLSTIAMETAVTNERLNLACRAAYSQIEAAFEAKLAAAGYPPPRARALATCITAAIEGGTMLSRVHHSGEPLRTVADLIGELLRPG